MLPALDRWLENYERAMWDGGTRFIEVGHFQNVSKYPRTPRPRSVVINRGVPTVGTKEDRSE